AQENGAKDTQALLRTLVRQLIGEDVNRRVATEVLRNLEARAVKNLPDEVSRKMSPEELRQAALVEFKNMSEEERKTLKDSAQSKVLGNPELTDLENQYAGAVDRIITQLLGDG